MCEVTSRCDNLKRQLTFWFHFNQQQSEKMEEQKKLLKIRRKEMETLNEQIMQLQEQLVKRKVQMNLQYR